MNNLEFKMVDLLKELREKYAARSVKVEFELEGTKIEDILRLKEVCAIADVDLTLKIGGCESVRDLLEARIIGVDCLVAPMIESSYALKKYLAAVTKIFPPDERESIEIFCNIETSDSICNLDDILGLSGVDALQGVVIERVDLCGSLGMDPDSINDERINARVLDAIGKAKKRNLICVIGGGVSAESLPFFRKIPRGYLDRYETRKVTFDAARALESSPEKGILKALEFELFWLKNKLNYYRGISLEDQGRIDLIEKCYWKEIDSML